MSTAVMGSETGCVVASDVPLAIGQQIDVMARQYRVVAATPQCSFQVVGSVQHFSRVNSGLWSPPPLALETCQEGI